MANEIQNPRKKFAFSVEFIGMPISPINFLCQNITLPKISVDNTAHGDANYDVKTGGRVKFTNFKAKKLETTGGPDNYMWNWILSVQNPIVKGGMTPAAYKKTVIVRELAEDLSSVINTHLMEGLWPEGIDEQELDRLSSDNTLESIEFSVDTYTKL